MRNFLLAISFLTILPAYGEQRADEKDMAASLYFYPLVGFVIGLFLVGSACIANWLSWDLAGDVLILVVWIVLTGALHLDGLMDAADGLFSGRDREQKLEIMRDTRVGAMGVVALAVVLLLKLSFLHELTFASKIMALFIAPAAGRWAMVYAVNTYQYARSGPGLGNVFGSYKGNNKIIGAGLILIAGTVLAGGYKALLVLLVTMLGAVLMARWIAGCLGGLTGDSYGAICECVETLFIIFTVLLLPCITLL
ncbi:MAG TPA: adenosylcobinamide-GDP ribazoletransferase [Syntrophomonadaceae bacterium]|nr:adenosylcobinamide-GDP ribazoletransferase [Syntrophomonadaceae bacterium]